MKENVSGCFFLNTVYMHILATGFYLEPLGSLQYSPSQQLNYRVSCRKTGLMQGNEQWDKIRNEVPAIIEYVDASLFVEPNTND